MRGGLTLKQRKYYERRMDIENKRREMAEEETSKKGGLTSKQHREYERRMEMENKWREMVEEEVLKGPTVEQQR